MIKFVCGSCGQSSFKSTGHYNRSKKLGLNLYCNRTCAGIAKRHNKSIEQKKEEKRQYDIGYRALNAERMKPSKHQWFKQDYAKHPEKYRLQRQRKYPKHAEYIKTPEYKAWKIQYDAKNRSKNIYGDAWEAHRALIELENEIKKHITKYEIRKQHGLLNKSLQRSRNGTTKRSYT